MDNTYAVVVKISEADRIRVDVYRIEAEGCRQAEECVEGAVRDRLPAHASVDVRVVDSFKVPEGRDLTSSLWRVYRVPSEIGGNE